MYIDALIDRDKDVIHVVERVDGKRVFREYRARYVSPITKTVVVSLKVYLVINLNVFITSGKQSQKERKLYSSQKLFESDVNPVLGV